MGTKNSSLVMVYSAPFNNAFNFKALNLFLNEIQLPAWQWQYHLAALSTTEVLHRVLTWLGICD